MAKPCKFCGSDLHASTFCFYRKKKRITKTGKQYYKWSEVRELWFEQNPPNELGYYECYLRIHPWCPVQMIPACTTLDHVRARSNKQSLKYDLKNLMPACEYCNGLKGSKSLEALSIEYPHLKAVINSLNLKST